MTNNRSIFALILCLLSLGSFAGASTPPAPPPPPPPPSLTITDAGAPEPPILHWSQFGTGCNATVANAPQSTTETTVTGPDYQWSCSKPNPGFEVTNNDSSDTILSSDPGELTAGNNDVTVFCTATYSSTDNTTGVVTAIPVSGSTDVTFFVRTPVVVVQISNMNDPGTAYSGPSPYSGPNLWGHDQDYHLQVQDNQPSPQPYNNGQAHEHFVQGTIYNGPDPSGSIVGLNPNGGKGEGTWNCSDFTDYIGFSYNKNMAAVYGWNVITLVIAWDQQFSCIESGHNPKTLNTFHIKNDYQTATRN